MPRLNALVASGTPEAADLRESSTVNLDSFCQALDRQALGVIGGAARIEARKVEGGGFNNTEVPALMKEAATAASWAFDNNEESELRQNISSLSAFEGNSSTLTDALPTQFDAYYGQNQQPRAYVDQVAYSVRFAKRFKFQTITGQNTGFLNFVDDLLKKPSVERYRAFDPKKMVSYLWFSKGSGSARTIHQRSMVVNGEIGRAIVKAVRAGTKENTVISPDAFVHRTLQEDPLESKTRCIARLMALNLKRFRYDSPPATKKAVCSTDTHQDKAPAFLPAGFSGYRLDRSPLTYESLLTDAFKEAGLHFRDVNEFLAIQNDVGAPRLYDGFKDNVGTFCHVMEIDLPHGVSFKWLYSKEPSIVGKDVKNTMERLITTLRERANNDPRVREDLGQPLFERLRNLSLPGASPRTTNESADKAICGEYNLHLSFSPITVPTNIDAAPVFEDVLFIGNGVDLEVRRPVIPNAYDIQ